MHYISKDLLLSQNLILCFLSQIVFKKSEHTAVGCLQIISRISAKYQVTSSCLYQNNKTKPFPMNSQFCTFIPKQRLIWLEVIKICYYYDIVQDEILNMPRRDNAQSCYYVHFCTERMFLAL